MTYKRDPKVITLAHKMDPERRSLYVEGRTDRLFLKWVAGDNLDNNTIIQEIATVYIPNVSTGGERARLLEFASIVENDNVGIKFFLDADFDRVLDRLGNMPDNVWVTDGRDLESYYLREDCFEKMAILAFRSDSFSGRDLLKSLMRNGRRLGLLRLYSEANSLFLPFQNTRLPRYTKFRNGNLNINFDRYLIALLNNSEQSSKLKPTILRAVEEYSVIYKDIGNFQILHGSDILDLVSVVCNANGLEKQSAEPILRSTYERTFVAEYPTLTQVVDFIM